MFENVPVPGKLLNKYSNINDTHCHHSSIFQLFEENKVLE
jgi:hypothetical protein